MKFSLAFLTLSHLEPHQSISLASRAGYDYVGIRMLPASDREQPYRIYKDDGYLKDIKNQLADNDIGLLDVELLYLDPGTNVMDYERVLSRASYLGATDAVLACRDPVFERASENLFKLAELASSYNIQINLEFMPWTAVRNLVQAYEMVETATLTNIKVLVDALHFDRSDSNILDLRRIPRELISFIQFCDAKKIDNPTTEQLIFTAREDRLCPGEGEINLKEFINQFNNLEIISIEIPNPKNVALVGELAYITSILSGARGFFEG